MPRSDQHAFDDLIRESEQVLRGAQGVPRPGQSRGAGPDVPAGVGVSAGKQELAALEAEQAQNADGYAEVRVSEDRMSARAAFFPAVGSGKPVDFREVQELVIARGLRFGINWDAVKSAITACNAARVSQRDIEVARGRKPVDELPPSIVIEEALVKKGEMKAPAGAAIDFKAISPFVMVKKGDPLARVTPGTEGISGIDVTGAVVAYGKAPGDPVKPGKNTTLEAGVIVASCDGRFVPGHESFWVSEVLEIPADVDFSTGHIDFPGDVVVKGEIKQGFKVKAGGSLFCARLIDATEVVCGGDLETGQGILGRMRGTVKVGGAVRAKFIENCYVEARGDVTVSTGCLNSVICTLGKVSTGPRGVIIGGKITAQRGVSTNQLGSTAGAKTEIHCGTDYVVQQKLTWIRDQNIALATKLKQVETTLASAGGRPDAKLLELQGKLKAAIRTMNNSAKSLVASLHKDEGAAVEVRGDAHHGVYIEICHVPLVLSASMSRVRFRLDKALGVISPDRIP